MSNWKLNVINVTSGYGGNTRQPFVEIHTDKLKEKEHLQLSPEEARDLAQNILEAAEAAEQDAFIFEFHRDLMNGDENVAANMLIQFRKWRDEHGQNK